MEFQGQIILIMAGLDSEYKVEIDFYLGESKKRDTMIYLATHKQQGSTFAFRYYTEAENPRPDYIQWQPTQIYKFQQLTIERMQFYRQDFDSLCKRGQLKVQHKIQIMLAASIQLEKHHKKSQVHGNIHSRNLLLDQQRKQVHFFDPLKGGNLDSRYSSPENQLYGGLVDSAVDVWSLGILFIQILSQWPLSQGQEQSMILRDKPYEYLLFPQAGWLQNRLKDVDDKAIKRLVVKMLDRNFKTRITMTKVVEILERIIKKQHIVQSFWSKTNQKGDLLPVRFSLIEQEKKTLNEKMYKMDQWIMRKKLKTKWLFQTPYVFHKNHVQFEYDTKLNVLKITVFHPDYKLPLLQATYDSNQVPVPVREKLELNLLVLLLYHTPAQQFQFLMNGELKVQLNESALENMVFDVSD